MNKTYIIFLCLLMGISGCGEFNQGAESVKSSYQKTASDTVIYTNVVQILQNIRRDLPSEVRQIVLQGRVLLVGYVASSQEHIDLINAVWQIKGVQEVIDHLEYAATNEKTGFEIKHAFLKTQLDSMFLTNSALHYNHFQYVMFKKNLYVLSSTSSESEKTAFFNMMRKMPTIQKVFFYSTYRQ